MVFYFRVSENILKSETDLKSAIQFENKLTYFQSNAATADY